MLTRRHFIQTSAALFSAPLISVPFAAPALAERTSDSSMWDSWDRQVTPVDYDMHTSNPWGLQSRFLPVQVEAKSGVRPGSIHVDAVARYLYHVKSDGTAMRYGVAIAKGNLYEPGVYNVRRKSKWPSWTPTPAMIEREPDTYSQFEDGMPGGPTNPLGSRALYLYQGNRDTYLRIHGTPHPRSVGGRASSGCVRMVMAHIIGLYEEVDPGVTAYLYPPEDRITAAS